jgi:dihydroxyacetone kinase-like protein
MSDFVAILRAVAEDLKTRADDLNRLDAEAGDGDLGVTVTNAAEAVLCLLPTLSGENLSEVLRTCGLAVAKEAPSTAGTLVAIGLLGASRVTTQDSLSASKRFADLLDASLRAIAERGKAEPGSKTMLDALSPASGAAVAIAARGGSLTEALDAAAAAADEGAQQTASMVPRFGRAAWLANRSAGHEDAGARLVAIIFESASRANRTLRNRD